MAPERRSSGRVQSAMQAFRVVALACALAGTFAVPGCATNPQPAPRVYTGDGDAAPYPEQWENQLGAYGDWRTVPRYGRVWYPYVGAGWRPYMYGSWAWGPSGWVWYSDEPWGFTFHYGRWAYAPVGWVWVPGTVWRSEEHTSELQSQSNLVCRLLLEKKKKNKKV